MGHANTQPDIRVFWGIIFYLKGQNSDCKQKLKKVISEKFVKLFLISSYFFRLIEGQKLVKKSKI